MNRGWELSVLPTDLQGGKRGWRLNKQSIANDVDFPGGSDGKASVYNAGDPGSSPGLERSPGEGNGNPLQYYCLENTMDRGAWQAAVFGIAKNRTRLHFIG